MISPKDAAYRIRSGELGGFVTGTDPRSPMSVGIEWASKISSLGFLFAIPPILGYVLDHKVGSAPVGLLVGMLLGFGGGMIYILRLARDSARPG